MGHFIPKIGVDLTGGDSTPESLFEDLVVLGKSFDTSVHLIFFIPEMQLAAFEHVVKGKSLKCQVSLVPTKETITMHDNPLTSIKAKKHSPMMTALRELKEGALDALVSIGNTGALIGGATLILKRIKSIRRPGLLALLPTLTHPLVVIDVGANVTSTALHLMQFAQIGIAYQKCLGIAHPKVALLNIGSEKDKGRKEMREAYKRLETLNDHHPSHPVSMGNIEGKKVFEGSVDVLVTDGFSGNIFLKTAEGMTSFILEMLSSSKQDLSDLKQLLDYAQYPGALICGVEGIVIKCHSYSTPSAIYHGIQGAINLVKSHFLQKLKKQLKI